jgi:hypothetical protein
MDVAESKTETGKKAKYTNQPKDFLAWFPVSI